MKPPAILEIVTRVLKNYLICAAILVSVVGVTLYPVCGAAFQCGCTIVGGAAHCNVHRAGVPHCPWCSASGWVIGVNFAVLFGATAGAAYVGLRRGLWVGVAGGLIGYVVSAAVVTFVTARAVGYPVWMGIRW